MVGVIAAAATAVAIAVVVTAVVAMVAATAAVATAVVATAAAIVVVAILDLVVLSLINPLAQKVGKTEVMEILLKTLNMKMAGVEEKEDCPMRAMLQMRQISNPFL